MPPYTHIPSATPAAAANVIHLTVARVYRPMAGGSAMGRWCASPHVGGRPVPIIAAAAMGGRSRAAHVLSHVLVQGRHTHTTAGGGNYKSNVKNAAENKRLADEIMTLMIENAKLKKDAARKAVVKKPTAKDAEINRLEMENERLSVENDKLKKDAELAVPYICIETKETPGNDHSLRFYSDGHTFLPWFCTMDFPDRKHLHKSPLAQQLFDIDGIEGVFLSEDDVTVTKSKSIRYWHTLTPKVRKCILSFAVSKKDILSEATRRELLESERLHEYDVDTYLEEGDSEDVCSVKNCLEWKIRPCLLDDGGNVRFVKLKGKTVYIRLEGAGRCEFHRKDLETALRMRKPKLVRRVKVVDEDGEEDGDYEEDDEEDDDQDDAKFHDRIEKLARIWGKNEFE